jgi:hypothetical protein
VKKGGDLVNEKTELSLYQSALKKHKETISDERNASNTEKPGLRIFCVGKIHKGKKTMIIAFPSERRKNHAAIPQGTEEKGET